jgi:hypothetical protein
MFEERMNVHTRLLLQFGFMKKHKIAVTFLKQVGLLFPIERDNWGLSACGVGMAIMENVAQQSQGGVEGYQT